MEKAAKPPITVISIRCFLYTLYLLNSRISCVICAFFLPPVFLPVYLPNGTKSRIIKAAWNLFYKHGYEQTTVDEIISASKTSKGTFYHYFKGKEALLNTLSYLFDEKYEELAGIVDPDLSAYDKLLFFNHELFHMIETSVDVGLLASLYSSQLITKDKRSLLENDRYYFVWLTETISTALKNGEFNGTSTADELLKIYAMYERAVLYDWALCKGKYSLTAYSDKLLPHVLDQFVEGF